MKAIIIMITIILCIVTIITSRSKVDLSHHLPKSFYFFEEIESIRLIGRCAVSVFEMKKDFYYDGLFEFTASESMHFAEWSRTPIVPSFSPTEFVPGLLARSDKCVEGLKLFNGSLSISTYADEAGHFYTIKGRGSQIIVYDNDKDIVLVIAS